MSLYWAFKKFADWAATQNLTDWKCVELRHLISFLQYERERALLTKTKDSTRRLSESDHLEIAAMRAALQKAFSI